MSDAEDLPEPDRAPGAPHPRFCPQVLGQDRAEADFLTAFNADRLHHGWLLTGPRGVGKASFAWTLARFLLATPADGGDGLFGAPPPPDSLHVDAEHPVARRLRALSEPGLCLIRRGGAGTTEREREKNYKDGNFSAGIRVDEIRKLSDFIHMSSADGGRRVVIVDAADDLNPNAANAILKMLEEPPARTTLLLISHQPSGLLPTIRSRCRELRLAPLSADDLSAALQQAEILVNEQDAAALSVLSEGSVGTAIRLITLDGLALYREILGLLGSLPALDRSRLVRLAESCAGRGKEERLALLLSLTDLATARIARTGVMGVPAAVIDGKEGEILRRLAPDATAARLWAGTAQEASDRARHALAVNVEPAALVTDLFLQLGKAAAVVA